MGNAPDAWAPARSAKDRFAAAGGAGDPIPTTQRGLPACRWMRQASSSWAFEGNRLWIRPRRRARDWEPLVTAACASMGRADRVDGYGLLPFSLSLVQPDGLVLGESRDSHGHGTDDQPLGLHNRAHACGPQAGPVGRPHHSRQRRPRSHGSSRRYSRVHARRPGVRIHAKPGRSCGGRPVLRLLAALGDRSCGRSPMARYCGRFRSGRSGNPVADLPGNASDVAGR